MVTKTNLLLIGLAVILLGFNSSSITRIFRPADIPETTIQMPNNTGQITFLQNQIKQAMSFLSSTFKSPILRKGLSGNPCRGPNCLGSFAAKGTRSGFDPFTGRRVVIGFTDRASTFLRKLNPDAAFNALRIEEAAEIKGSVLSFIDETRTQIGLLEAENAV